MQTPKKFSSFSDQVSWISDEKGIKIKDREYAEEMLRQIGYFPLMGGYKHLFRISNTKKYKAGTSFEEIVSLYKFDAELRELFFKYLLQIERQMRSLMSYYFTEMYGAEQKQYLDAQKEKLKRYAEFQNMEIVNEYSDEGKSGKSVEGRPEFQRMLDNIENGTDEVQFVLVFKLSRFGRNAADVLNSLQRMQDFGVNLICVEDGIDNSKDSGKLMISVLSAVAETERENIRTQTMAGRTGQSCLHG